MKWVRTCRSCNFDNPGDAKRCNKCGNLFVDTKHSIFSDDKYLDDHYFSRWVCPKCGIYNMADNKTCYSCDYRK